MRAGLPERRPHNMGGQRRALGVRPQHVLPLETWLEVATLRRADARGSQAPRCVC